MSGTRKRFPARSGWRLAPLLAILVSTVACLEHTVLLKLRPDGSGELIETSLVKGQMLEMARAMTAMEGEGEGGGLMASQADEKRAEAEARAARLGEGVTFVSWEPISEEGKEGEHIVYRFDDVTKLNLQPGPDSGDGGEAPMTGPGESIRFRLADLGAGRSRLVAVFGEESAPEGTVAEGGADELETASAEDAAGTDDMAGMEDMAEAMGAGMMEMMKPFLQGMKMRVVVEVEGEVLETDAPFSEGSQVTLLEIDFDQIVADPEAWKKLSALDSDASLAVLGPQLQGLPGVRAPVGREVSIEFRPR
jgi:hypothetical protein